MIIQEIFITLIASILIIYLCRYIFLRLQIFDRNEDGKTIKFIAIRSAGVPLLIIFILINFFIMGDTKVLNINYYFLYIFVLLGFYDDIKHINPLPKFLFQFFFSFLLLLIEFGGKISFDFFSILLIFFSIIFIIWQINLFNFMDGIDGILGFQFIFMILTLLFFILIDNGNKFFNDLILYVIPVLVFLFFNFNAKTKFYLGDSGAYLLAIFLICLSVLFIQINELKYVYIILLSSSIFFMDALTTLLVRLFQNKKYYKRHTSHGYQILQKKFNSHFYVCAIYLFINIFFIFPMICLFYFEIINFLITVSIVSIVLGCYFFLILKVGRN